MILVTGGAGFIGSNFVLDWLAASDEPVLNLDAITYAGNPDNLAAVRDNPRHVFVQGDITDPKAVGNLLLPSLRWPLLPRIHSVISRLTRPLS